MTKIDFTQAAECLKTIAHADRLAIIDYLLEQKKACVGEIAEHCQLQPHMASEHLSLLKDRGYLQSRRDGRKVFYAIKERALESIMNCIHTKFKR